MPDTQKETQRKPADKLVKQNAGVALTEQELEKVDGGSPNLSNACATGKHFDKATITT